jgi:hypothetical protein
MNTNSQYVDEYADGYSEYPYYDENESGWQYDDDYYAPSDSYRRY